MSAETIITVTDVQPTFRFRLRTHDGLRKIDQPWFAHGNNEHKLRPLEPDEVARDVREIVFLDRHRFFVRRSWRLTTATHVLVAKTGTKVFLYVPGDLGITDLAALWDAARAAREPGT